MICIDRVGELSYGRGKRIVRLRALTVRLQGASQCEPGESGLIRLRQIAL